MQKMNGLGPIYSIPDALLMEKFVMLSLTGEIMRMLLQQSWWRSWRLGVKKLKITLTHTNSRGFAKAMK